MLPNYGLEVDKADLARLEETFGGMSEKVDRVLYRALNTASGRMRTKVVRIVGKVLAMKTGLVRKRLWITRANRRRLLSILTGGRVGWPLIDFGAMQIGKAPKPGGGVRASVPGSKGKVQMIPHAFIARMRSGHRGVFQRKGLRSLPIVEERSRDVTEIIESAAAVPEILADARVTLRKRIEAEMELILSGKRT